MRSCAIIHPLHLELETALCFPYASTIIIAYLRREVSTGSKATAAQ